MASMTVTASFLGGSAAGNTKQQPSKTRLRQGIVMANASKVSEEGVSMKKDSGNGRREMVFGGAAAAAAGWLVVDAAVMAEEPKAGTIEAKKKYAPVCVTMPTARICHK